MYTKKFEIRWSDIDANRHLANTAYINFMSHTRMGFLMENGFGQKDLAKHNLGPVVFYEHVYYFKEVFAGEPVKVSLQLKGLSEDGMYFEFVHNFYDSKGRNFASCEMMGGWIDLKERKLTGLPPEMVENLDSLTHTDDFKVLTKEDTRKHGRKPQDIDPELLT
ncbi:MAG: thioesterase [Flavobacteriaceae bacterium]|nr:thioesterase [Flavobacteriaceae bacterium]|tara:strand:- start:347 stop:838 length:492 start_codon:yes stop_codon:yes gene_type:complete